MSFGGPYSVYSEVSSPILRYQRLLGTWQHLFSWTNFIQKQKLLWTAAHFIQCIERLTHCLSKLATLRCIGFSSQNSQLFIGDIIIYWLVSLASLICFVLIWVDFLTVYFSYCFNLLSTQSYCQLAI